MQRESLLLLLTITCTSVAIPQVSETLLWGNGLIEAHAGTVSSFHLQTRDSEGQNTTIDASEISVRCVSAPEVPYDFCAEDPVVETLGSGLFQVRFTVGRFWAEELDPVAEGLFPNPLPRDFFSQTDDRLHVKIAGSHVPGSPFSPLLLGNSTMDPTTSLITATASVLVAGVSTLIGELHAIRDSFGNNIRLSVLDEMQSVCRLTEASLGSANSTALATVDPSWVLGNWYVQFLMRCFVSGNYAFQVSVNSVEGTETQHFPIKSYIDGGLDTQWYLTCVPNAIDYMSCEVPEVMSVGTLIEISVQAYDEYGNAAYLVGNASPLTGLTINMQDDSELVVSVLHDSCNCSLVTSMVLILDEVPGRVHVQFTTAKPGLHRFHVAYKGVEYTPESIVLNIQPGSPAIAQSKAFIMTKGDIEGQLSLQAGVKETVYLQLKDLYNNPTPVEVVELSARLINREDPAESLLTFEVHEEDSIGLYYFTLQATKAGAHDLFIAYKGQLFFNSPLTVFIEASEIVDPQKSVIVGSAIGIEIGMEEYYITENYRQIAGRNMSLIITAVDLYGNPQTTTQPNFKLNQELEQVATWMDQVQTKDGTTKFYFAIELVGVYYVQVSYHGVTVYEADLEVGPGGVLHSNCQVFGLEATRAGELGRGYLQVRDTYGNLYSTKYQSLIELEQFFIGFLPEGEASSKDPTYVQFGEYNQKQQAVEFAFNLTRSGRYSVFARWESWPVQGHESSLEILPGPVSPRLTRVFLHNNETKAGTALLLTVEFRDLYDNLIAADLSLTEKTTVKVETLDGQEVHNASVGVTIVNEGVLQGSVRIVLQGEYRLRVFLDGECVASCEEWNFTVQSTEFAKMASNLEFEKEVSTEAWNEVLFFPRDEYSNSLYSEAFISGLSVEVVGIEQTEAQQFETTDISGQLRAHYLLRVAGSYQLVILHDSKAIYTSSTNITAVNLDDQEEVQSSENWLPSDMPVLGLMAAGSLVLLIAGYWFCIRDQSEPEPQADIQLHYENEFDSFMKSNLDNKCDNVEDLANEPDTIKAHRA